MKIESQQQTTYNKKTIRNENQIATTDYLQRSKLALKDN